jgi:hypothetical protein
MTGAIAWRRIQYGLFHGGQAGVTWASMHGSSERALLALAGAAVAWGAACGRVGFDADPVAGDAAVAPDARGDVVDAAAPDAKPVDIDAASGPFSEPVLIENLSDPVAAEDDPTVTADLLELYFESDRFDGRGDILVSRRSSPAEPWGAPELVDELSDPSFDEETPEISADGLTILLSIGGRPDSLGGSDLYMATRPDRGSAWSAPVHVDELSSTAGEGAAAVDASGLRLVLHSGRNGGTMLDLFEATRSTPNAPWSAPQRIDELSTAGTDGTPYLVGGGLVLYFASDRPGSVGELDLFVATRPALDAAFSEPEPVSELNTAASLEDPWLSPDERYIVFADTRSGAGDIYEAWR